MILLYHYSENNVNTLSDDRKGKGILDAYTDAYSQLRKLDWKMKDPEDEENFGFIYFQLDKEIILSSFNLFNTFREFPEDKKLQREQINAHKKKLYEKKSGRKTVLEPSNQFLYFE